MKLIKEFSDFEPDNNEIKVVKNFLSIAYPVRSQSVMDKNQKYILVDDKVIYLTGPFLTKNRSSEKLYHDVRPHFEKFKESSIRRAIKDFFDFYK